jgi:hypothetical protein
MSVTYELTEPQAVAILAALKLLEPSKVSTLNEETKGNLSMAYHRLRGKLTRSLQNGMSENVFI